MPPIGCKCCDQQWYHRDAKLEYYSHLTETKQLVLFLVFPVLVYIVDPFRASLWCAFPLITTTNLSAHTDPGHTWHERLR